jgi:hypothetical protein
MTRDQASKRLGKLFGKRALYRVVPGASNADEREAATTAQRELNALRREVEAKLAARREELLGADARYQEMAATLKRLRKEQNTLTGLQLSYRFTAGYEGMGFFHVEAQGDTWEEVFAILDRKYPDGKSAVSA